MLLQRKELKLKLAQILLHEECTAVYLNHQVHCPKAKYLENIMGYNPSETVQKQKELGEHMKESPYSANTLKNIRKE